MSLSVAAPAAAQSSTPYNSITLDWTAPGDDGIVGQVSSYQLRYSTTPVGTDVAGWWNGVPALQQLTLVPPPALAPAGAPDSYTVTGLSQGTTYYFVLRALDEAYNISDFSNVAPGTTLLCNVPAVSQFGAVADTGQVSVSWSSTNDPLALSLNLYRAQGTNGSWVLLQNLSLGTTSYLDTSVAAGTVYRYRAAWMGAVCEGPTTSTVTVTTPGIPPPPPTVGAEGSTIHAYPNPASDGPIHLVVRVTASTSQAVSVRLFDTSGHWIATVADGSFSPGSSEVTWNRVNRLGGAVAPGLYELIGTVGSAQVRERLVLLP
jgi:hypothetical protein